MTTIKQFLTARPKLLTLYVKVGTRLTDILASLSKNVSEHLRFMLYDREKDFAEKKAAAEKLLEEMEENKYKELKLSEIDKIKMDFLKKEYSKINDVKVKRHFSDTDYIDLNRIRQYDIAEKVFNEIKEKNKDIDFRKFLQLTDLSMIDSPLSQENTFDKEKFEEAKKTHEKIMLAIKNMSNRFDRYGQHNHDHINFSDWELDENNNYANNEIEDMEKRLVILGEKIQSVKAQKEIEEQKPEPIVFQSSVDISTQSISDFDQHLTDAQKDIEANKEVSPVISLILDKSPTKDELEEFKKTFEETKKNNNCCMLNHSSKIELVELKEDDKQITFDDYIKTKDTVNANVSGFETVIVRENK